MASKKYTPQEIARLILSCSGDDAEEARKARLQEWIGESEENRRFYERIISRAYWETGWQEYMNYSSRRDWKRVKMAVKPRKISLFRRLLPYAAFVAVVIGAAIVIRYKDVSPDTGSVLVAEQIRPGASKAQLVLSDGRKIDLEAEEDSLYRQIEGENFVNDSGQLTYRDRQKSGAVRFHTIRIPRGGEYKVTLADGTRIWLNAASELIYPDYFQGRERQVVLKGEAYFEVAKDTERPFYVRIGDMKISVLGTSFNVSAYPGSERRTTLVEGKVAIDWKQQHVEILPGQQAVETGERLEIARVNVANYMGWKERRFVYEDKLLGEVLEELERWYDVEIFVLNDGIRKLHLTANLPKYENMDQVLRIIEDAACVRFDVKDRTVVVSLDR